MLIQPLQQPSTVNSLCLFLGRHGGLPFGDMRRRVGHRADSMSVNRAADGGTVVEGWISARPIPCRRAYRRADKRQRIRHLVLAHQPLITIARQVLCSVETFRPRTLIFRYGKGRWR